MTTKQAYQLNPSTARVVCSNCGEDVVRADDTWYHYSRSECMHAEPAFLHPSRAAALEGLSHRLGLGGEITPQVFAFIGLMDSDDLLCECERELGIASKAFRAAGAVSRREVASWLDLEVSAQKEAAARASDPDVIDSYVEGLEYWAARLGGE